MDNKNSYEEMKQFAKKYAGGKTRVKGLHENISHNHLKRNPESEVIYK